MSAESVNPKALTPKPGFRLSVDVWAVLLAFVLALLVWLGVLQHIPW
jgi:hypothetical protein